jgi:hypothetical protein
MNRQMVNLNDKHFVYLGIVIYLFTLRRYNSIFYTTQNKNFKMQALPLKGEPTHCTDIT